MPTLPRRRSLHARLQWLRSRIERSRSYVRRILWRLVRGLMIAGAAIGPAPPPPPPPAPHPTEQVAEDVTGEEE